MSDFDTFWSLYPADLCGGSKKKGGRSKAEESWVKHVKEPEAVILALQAQIKYDREAIGKGEDVDRWPFASTWLNQSRWDVEIESHAELESRYQANFCHCGKETHGPRFDQCLEHLCFDKQGRMKPGLMVQEMRDYYAKHGEMDHQEAMKFMKGLRG